MEIFHATKIFSDTKRTLIAIKSVNFRHSKTRTNCQLYGNIEPIAVIVCCADEVYALDMRANYTTLDKLRQDIPDLDTIIAPFNID